MNPPAVRSSSPLDIQQAINILVGSMNAALAQAGPECFVYQPGGTAGGNVYTDWASLVQSASRVSGCKLVYFDDAYGACIIPANGDLPWRLGGYTKFMGRQRGRGACELTFEDGARIVDVYEFLELNLISVSSSSVIRFSDFQFPAPPRDPEREEGDPRPIDPIPPRRGPSLLFRLGSGTTMTAAGDASFYSGDTARAMAIFWLEDDASIISSGGAVLSSGAVDSNITVIANGMSLVGQNTMIASQFAGLSGIVISPAAEIDPQQVSGSLSVQYLSQSSAVRYDDAQSPSLGADLVQGAIDALKPKGGDTQNRPVSPYEGQFYYDTQINKPIWWSTGSWRDASGNAV